MKDSEVPEAADAARRNVRTFVLFRVLFNSRLYYPVFTILFLDFGLSLEQFAVLNAVWAATIVLSEVPSGALADRFGRRRLVIWSGWLMLLEMTILCLTPAGGAWVFPVFLVNRIISGLAEAACSGADEAMVYDSLPPEARTGQWTRTLSALMRAQSMAFLVVALVGAATYSVEFMNRVSSGLGLGDVFTREVCRRIPLALNWLMAVGTLVVSYRFIDLHPPAAGDTAGLIRSSFRQMIAAGRWILTSPPATVIILTGFLYDGFLRLFYSVASNYYRLIGLETEYYGVILAGSSLLGLVTAEIVERLVGRFSPSRNFGIVAVSIFAGLAGISMAVPGWAGVIFVVPFWLAMRSLHYFISQYLNRLADSRHRATVLSFKGLTMNLAYGASMLAFQAQTAALRAGHSGELAELTKEQTDVRLLALATPWWPATFALLAAGLALWVRLRWGRGLSGLMRPH